MLKCNWEMLQSMGSVVLMPLMLELDEQWSFVKNKKQQRWLWLAICHKTGKIVAYCFGRRTDDAFLLLLKSLQCFNFNVSKSKIIFAHSAFFQAGPAALSVYQLI